MRQILAAFILICILAGGVRCIYSMESIQLHQEELEIAMEMAMRHSLTAAVIKKNYPVTGDQELYSDFLGELFLILGADAECDINVYELNLEEGAMDIETTVYFSLPWGGKEQVSCRKYAVVVETQDSNPLSSGG